MPRALRVIIRYPHGIPPSRAPSLREWRLIGILPAGRGSLPARSLPPRQTSTGTPICLSGSQPDDSRYTAWPLGS
jgi:hypothetical protein